MRVKVGFASASLPDADKDIDTYSQFQNPSGITNSSFRNSPLISNSKFRNLPEMSNHHSFADNGNYIPNRNKPKRHKNRHRQQHFSGRNNNHREEFEAKNDPLHSDSPPPLPQLLFENEVPNSSGMTISLVGSTSDLFENDKG